MLFKISDLCVDGRRFTSDDRLSSALSLGDVLYSFSKPLVPQRTIGDTVVKHQAVQVMEELRMK